MSRPPVPSQTTSPNSIEALSPLPWPNTFPFPHSIWLCAQRWWQLSGNMGITKCSCFNKLAWHEISLMDRAWAVTAAHGQARCGMMVSSALASMVRSSPAHARPCLGRVRRFKWTSILTTSSRKSSSLLHQLPLPFQNGAS